MVPELGSGSVAVLLILFAANTPVVAAPRDAPAVEHFEKRVRPLLHEKCLKCHGPDKSKGGLRLDSAAGLAKGGDSGRVVVPGRPDESLLIRAVRQTGDIKMPADGKLTDQQIADLVAWVRAGVVWPGDTALSRREVAGASVKPVLPIRHTQVSFRPEEKAFWSFQPVRDRPLPAVKDEAWVQSPIDRFILAKLEAKGLKPAPRADKRTLIRRTTFDLTGLPPTLEEIDAFLADNSPKALQKVVNRLLDSPHYGERWGRHWLDVVRYADTAASDANAVMRYAYRYRDYVVDAFNHDLPYDQFIVEQLAGDLLPPTQDISRTFRRVIASGFLMLGPKSLSETDAEQVRMDIVDEQMDVTGRALLGLTLGCARCHDHKFDPIPTIDYYSLAGIFRSTDPLQDEKPTNMMFQQWPLFQDQPLPGETPFMVMAPKEGRPVNLRVHLRGNRFNLGVVAPRRFPQVLAGTEQKPLETSQSGRLELARWIAGKDNPLTARVMVNRIWQCHFGTGLVATSDNFGTRGEAPSHPELLDWLAAQFVASGWSVKAMHRRVLLSSTYQQSSAVNERALGVDPNNRLLWRMPRQRLEAEAIRDAMLAVSGRLDRTVGGGEAGEFLFKETKSNDKRGFAPNAVQSNHPYYTTSARRSIYLPVVRNALPDMLALLDAADPNSVTAVRSDTTVPPQALLLLNSPFVREQALHFAKQLLADAKVSDEDRLRTAYLRALGRPLRAEERAEANDYLQRYAATAQSLGPAPEARLAAWQSYCQLLMCLNELLYVD